MSRNQRVVVLGLAVLVVVVAVVVIGTGGSSNSTKSAGPTTVVVQDAKPVGGVKDVTFKKGGTIDLTVKSDTADEVHFHGYDVHKDVAKGGSVQFRVPGEHRGQVHRRAREPQADAGQRHRRAVRRRLAPRRGAGAERHAGAPGKRARPRPGRQAGPADPALAVRVGGRGGARGLLRRPRRAVAAPAPGERARARRADRARGAGGAVRCAGRGRLRRRGVGGLRGHSVGDRQPRADVHLRGLLGGDPVRHRAARRRLRGLQPVAGGGARRRLGLRARAPRRRAARADGLPAMAGTLAGRAGDPGLRVGRAGLRQQGRPQPAGDDGAALCRGAARRDEPLRHRRVVAQRRRVRRVLPAVLDALAAALARAHAVRAPAAGRRAEAEGRAGHRADAVHDDRHRQLRRPLAGIALDGPGRDRRRTCSSASSTSASAARWRSRSPSRSAC